MKTKFQLLVFWLTIAVASIFTYVLSVFTKEVHASIIFIPLILLSLNTGSEVIRDWFRGYLFVGALVLWIIIITISMIFYQFYWNSVHVIFIIILMLNNYTNLFNFQMAGE